MKIMITFFSRLYVINFFHLILNFFTKILAFKNNGLRHSNWFFIVKKAKLNSMVVQKFTESVLQSAMLTASYFLD